MEMTSRTAEITQTDMQCKELTIYTVMQKYTQAVIKTNQKALSENLSELRYKNVCTQFNS